MNNKFITDNNFSKNTKYKKISYNKNMNNNINKNIKNMNTEGEYRGEYNGQLNFKNTLHDGNNSIYNTSTSFSNQSKTKNSHSVSSIRARLKNKNFK